MNNRDNIKTVAIAMVKKSGLINLSRSELCKNANIPDGSFPHVMGCTFTDFVEELRAENVEQGIAPVSKRRAPAALRKEQLLKTAVELATEQGYTNVTRDGIANAAGVSFGLITKYFGTMNQLRRDVMRAAINQEIPEIVAQGLANGDERAKKAPAELKAKALELFAL